MEPQEQQNLQDELLEAANPPEPQTDAPPKKNTKQALLEKILQVSERDGIPLEYTNSKLKRMSKKELAQVLADLIEEGIKRQMAQKVGCAPGADERTIALGALRMVHDVCAMGVEKAGCTFLEPRGYEINGFTEALKEPTVSSQIDQCLEEIAQENMEILEYVQSPYSRLAIAWAGALCFSVQKKQKHVTFLEPQASRGENTVRRRVRRRPPTGQINNHVPSATPDEKPV